MPAKSAAQLRRAYAAARRGEAWGKEMIAKTPKNVQRALLRGKVLRRRKRARKRPRKR